mgnify:CR=1 FL=1
MSSDDGENAPEQPKLSKEEMMAAIGAFVSSGVKGKPKKDVYRVYKAISKPKRKSGFEIKTNLALRVNSAPMENWKPIDVDFSKKFLAGMRERRACRSTPMTRLGHDSKFLCAQMIGEIRGSIGISQRDHSLARDTLCRVMEEAVASKTSNAAFAELLLPEPQVAHQSVDWLPNSRGAGLLYANSSAALLDEAISAMQARIESF